MKLVMNLIVAAAFAAPAFASEKDGNTVAVKNRGEITKVVSAAKAQELNAEEEKGKDAYRLQDPNASKSSKSEKTVTVRPWTGSNRERILTPPEYDREVREGKHSTYAGSEVGKNYPTVYGVKVKVKHNILGGKASQ